MASVSERLRIIREEQRQGVTFPLSLTIEDNPSIMSKVIEKEEEAKRAAEIAQDFFRASGIKLIFMEMDEELLHGKGQIEFENFGEYSVHGLKQRLWYEADLSLNWTKGLFFPTNYSLIASIQGNLLDEQVIKKRKLHRKSLSIDLKEQSSSKGFFVTYDNEFFDTENPNSEDLNTIRKWTEANIVNFVRQKERAREKPIF